MYILDNITGDLIEAEIIKATRKEMPLKKNGWHFNWRKVFSIQASETFVLRLKSNPTSIQGVLLLRNSQGMLIMDLIEVAPHNIGTKNNRYSYVAGCLIAFACRESFKLKSNYNGFLTFDSETTLTNWYVTQYNAQVAMGQKMFIDPKGGKRLIDKYLKRNRYEKK